MREFLGVCAIEFVKRVDEKNPRRLAIQTVPEATAEFALKTVTNRQPKQRDLTSCRRRVACGFAGICRWNRHIRTGLRPHRTMAERVGFEPTAASLLRRFSRANCSNNQQLNPIPDR